MSKPQWLKDKESGKVSHRPEPKLCGDCIYFGRFHHNTKHKGKTWTEVKECDIHPGCMNTKFSVCCSDWTPADSTL